MDMMVSSGKRIYLLSVLLAMVSACSFRGTPVNKTDQAASPVFTPSEMQLLTDTRQRLLKWYDSTDRVYYGLKGPVKTLSIGVLDQEDPEVWEPPLAKRVINFQRNGHVNRIHYRHENGEVVVVHHYDRPGILNGYDRVDNDEKQHSVTFDYYPDGRLKNIQQKEHGSNAVSNIQFSYQMTGTGWFEIAKPREAVDLPGYTQFSSDTSIEWTSKGGVNNDPEALYYLPTRDKVTSSSIRQGYTPVMAGVGGYRYSHYPNGQLQSVNSFSGNNNGLYHTTRYTYNKIGLLASEVKRVTGVSLFNSANNEAVRYVYQKIDEYGNWLERELHYTNGSQSEIIYQTRSLQYFANNLTDNITDDYSDANGP